MSSDPIPFDLIIVLTVSLVLLTSLCAIVLYYYKKSLRLQSELAHEHTTLVCERKGRTKAEHELRQLHLKPNHSFKGVKSPLMTTDDPQEQEVIAKESVYSRIAPIGFVRSPFAKKVLIPRQSQLCQARFEIVVEKALQPELSFRGIDEYNYLWVIFLFHENTNMLKSTKFSINALITPPRSPDKKYGIYATRTPHRHNHMGLSLVKLTHWDQRKGIMTVTGGDFLDNTPVLDIKPFHPCEVLTMDMLQMPDFVRTDLHYTVECSQNAAAKIIRWCDLGKLRHYKKGEGGEFLQVLTDILSQQDPRSQWQKGKEEVYYVELEGIRFALVFKEDDVTMKGEIVLDKVNRKRPPLKSHTVTIIDAELL